MPTTSRRILVTGGSGFIGTNLVERLRRDDGWDVRSIDVAAPRLASHAAHWTRVDVRDEGALRRCYDEVRPEVVVHLAARTDLVDSPDLSAYDANVLGVRNVLALGDRTEHTIYASSRLVFEIAHRPTGPWDYSATTDYGRSKVRGEELVRASATPWSLVRPTSIWGPWFGTPYRDFFDAVLAGRYVHPRGREVRKSFGYVGNAVTQLVALIQHGPGCLAGQPMWLADYRPIDVREWADEISARAGLRPVRVAPLGVLRAAAFAGDLSQRLGGPAPLTSFRLRNLCTDMVYDTSTTERVSPDAVVDVSTGIRETLAWLDATT